MKHIKKNVKQSPQDVLLNNEIALLVEQQKKKTAGSLFALEQRYLLDGAMMETAADAIDQQTAAQTQEAQQAEEKSQTEALAISELNENYQAFNNNKTEIIFIDGAVSNIADLLADIHPSSEVHVLDQNQNGVEQIAAILNGRGEVDAIHILSHGAEGKIYLGNDVLDIESMQGKHADELTIIKNALDEQGDILMYGCDLAGNEEGKLFVDTLAELTGADIAASIDDTGAAQFGANWELEVATGEIAVQALAITDFVGVLADTDGDGVDDAIDIDDDNDGILDVDEMEAVNTGLLADYASVATPAGTDLNGLTIGTAIPGVNITHSNSGSMALLAYQGTVGADPYVWGNEVFFGGSQLVSGAAESDTAVFTFNQALENVDVRITDVDYVNGGLYERVQVIGRHHGQIVHASSVSTGSSIGVVNGFYQGTSATTGGSNPSDPNIMVTFTFDQPIDQYEVLFERNWGAGITVNAFAGRVAIDADGINNQLDLDSDNDGISDLVESGATAAQIAADTNNDGTISLTEAAAANGGIADADGDGLMDIFDADDADVSDVASIGTTPLDSDNDGVKDFVDLDSDGDGIADAVEARPTAGYVANDGDVTDNDADGDGIIDLFDSNDATTGEFGGTHTNLNAPVDTDNDGTADYLDTDSDNDLILDEDESGLTLSGADANNDGIDDDASIGASYLDPDGTINNPSTGLNNEIGDSSEVAYREVTDTDGDGILDNIDIDDDNDGILDTNEELNGATLSTYTTSTSTQSASGPIISTPTPGYVVTDTSSGDIRSFTATSVSESGDGGGRGTLSEILIDFDLALGEKIVNSTLTFKTPGFDDGLYIEINGVTVVDFRSLDYAFDPAIQSKYGNGDIWSPWTGEGDPELVLDTQTGTVALMVDTSSGGRENILVDIAGSRPNPMPTIDFNSGVTLGTAYNNDGGPGTIGIQTVTFSAELARDSDNDSVAGNIDLDSDNDGISDLVESGATAAQIAADTNNDGTVSAQEADLANDGLDNDNEDVDGDGLMDIFEDVYRVAGYINGDNFSRNGGFTDASAQYTFGDLTEIVFYDDDGNFDGDTSTMGETIVGTGTVVIDGVEYPYLGDYGQDFHGDDGSTYNFLVVDVDFDGNGNVNAPGFIENGVILIPMGAPPPIGAVLTAGNSLGNPDGTASWSIVTRANGMQPLVSGSVQPIDTDNDGVKDFVDLDSDGDGIADAVEARPTAGYVANDGDVTDNDADGDGIIDLFDSNDATTGEFGGTHTNLNAPVDTDNDGTADYLDTDSDNDLILDEDESGLTLSGADANNDGIDDDASIGASYLDPDGTINNPSTGLNNEIGDSSEVAYREVPDTDGDGILDNIDIDDDNDGILDVVEMEAVNTGLLADYVSVGTPTGTDLNGLTIGTAIPGVNITHSNSGPMEFSTYMGDSNFYGGKAFFGGYRTGDYVESDTAVFTLNQALENIDVIIEDLDYLTNGRYERVQVIGRYNGQVVNASNVVAGSNVGVVNGFYQGTSATTGVGNPSDPNLRVTFTFDQPIDQYEVIYERNTFESITIKTLDGRVAVDADGINNQLDLDSDNDGISDLVESGATAAQIAADTNNDGTISLTEAAAANGGIADADGDGLMDIFDADDADVSDVASIGTTPLDSDNDGVKDFVDLDSDGDGIADAVEARPTAGYVANDGDVTDNDADGDGIIDLFDSNDATTGEFGGTHTNLNAPVDTDNDGTADYLDTDSDNDLILDEDESGLTLSGADANNDGIDDDASIGASYLDPDGTINNPSTGLNNEIGDSSEVAYREVTDTDGDGILDNIDIDDDNDGILDTNEELNGATLSTYTTSTSTQSASGPIISTPTPGYVVTDTSSGDIRSFTATSVSESGDGGGRGTLSEILIDFDLALGEKIVNSTLTFKTPGFDDGLYIEINGVTVVDFRSLDYAFDPAIQSKYGNGDIWSPWTGEGDPELVLDTQTGTVALMVDTSSGGRENILVDIAGSRPNPMPTIDFNSGVTLGTAYNNDGGPGTIGIQTVTFSAELARDSDNDSVAGNIDLDSDNDGISDLVESGATAAQIAADTNNDGTVSAQEADLANDGLDNDNEDVDGDGLMDIFEDVYRVAGYINGDNFSRNGGFTDASAQYTFGDLTEIVFYDDDGNFDGDTSTMGETIVGTGTVVIDGVEYPYLGDYGQDFHGDDGSTYNFLVVDVDFDGNGNVNAPGFIENGVILIPMGAPPPIGAVLTAGNSLGNPDGTASWSIVTRANGMQPLVSGSVQPIDTDNDGVKDFVDLDSDGDGIADAVEARPTAGYVANDGDVTDNDADGDGIIDLFDSNDATTGEFGGTHTNLNAPVDTDNDGTADYLDTDSDNDLILDEDESGLTLSGADANNDGIDDDASIGASYLDPDGTINNPSTGLNNEIGDSSEVAYREVTDTDGDGILDNIDIDDDNDGILDVVEMEAVNTGLLADYVSVGTPAGTDLNGVTIGTAIPGVNITHSNSGPMEFLAYQGIVGAHPYVWGNDAFFGGSQLVSGAAESDTAVFTFNQALENIDVIIEDLDYLTNGRYERVQVVGRYNGQVVNASNIVAGSSIGVVNGFYQATSATTGASDPSDPSIRVTFTFDQPIDQYEVIYERNTALGIAIKTLDGRVAVDADGINNQLDLDSDNDGISDLVESGATAAQIAADTNNDGTISLTEAAAANGGIADADGDGLMDIFDADDADVSDVASIGTTPLDSDNDGVKDFVDLDSDGDGIADAVEARPTAGYVANDGDVTDNDADGDGIIDLFDSNDATTGEFGGTHTNLNAPVDTDNDGTADYLDTDSDNDLILDEDESGLTLSGADANNDGIDDDASIGASYLDPDGTINNPSTGLNNEIGDSTEVAYREHDIDTDGDGILDIFDVDDDNDGILDVVEMRPINNNNSELSLYRQVATMEGTDLNGVTVATIINGLNITHSNSGPMELTSYLGTYGASPFNWGFEAYFGGPQSVSGAAESGTAVFAFNHTVEYVDVRITDLDYRTGEQYERVQVIGRYNGEIVQATSVAMGSSIGVVDGFYQATSASPGTTFEDDPNITVTFSFDQPIDQYEVLFERNSGAGITVRPYEGRVHADADGDGIANHLDLDSDNDGISDLTESGQDASTVDTNNDGVRDDVATSALRALNDVDNDGLADAVDNGNEVTPRRSDYDNEPDFIDLDSDGDGIADAIEARPTADGNVIVNGGAAGDSDNDGILDHFDTTNDGVHGGNFATPVNTDAAIGNNADTNPDYIDTDSDGDSILDNVESGLGDIGLDENYSGFADYNDGIGDIVASANNISYADADGTIVPSADIGNEIGDTSEVGYREIRDTDGDGIADAIDIDDDNDGILDVNEKPLVINTSFSIEEDGQTLFSTGKDVSNFIASSGAGIPGYGLHPTEGTRFVYFNSSSSQDSGTVYRSLGTIEAPGSYVVSLDVGRFFDFEFLTDIISGVTTGGTSGDMPGTFIESQVRLTPEPDEFPDDTWDTWTYSFKVDAGDPLIGQDFGMQFTAVNNGLNRGAAIDNIRLHAMLDQDTDGDGINDHLDLDSDNDGISDLTESGQDASTVDTNNDGVRDDVATSALRALNDVDNDGLADAVDNGNEVTPRHSDADGIADFLDLDSDNDHIADAIEARPTADGNVIVNGGAAGDSDNDGILDHFDTTNDGVHGGNFATPVNTDAAINNNADTNPDYIDTDSDGDGLLDNAENIFPITNDDNDHDGIDDLVAEIFDISYADADGTIVPSADLSNFVGDTTEVAYRELNQPPVLDLNDNSTSADRDNEVIYTLGGVNVNLIEDDAGVFDTDSTDINEIIITPDTATFVDGANEFLIIAGQDIAITSAPAGVSDIPVTVGVTSFNISVIRGTGVTDVTISITAVAGSANIDDVNTLLRGIEYRNDTVDAATLGNRDVNFSIYDHQDQNTGPATATIMVVDPAPVIDLNDDNTTSNLDYSVNPYTEDDGAIPVTNSDAVAVDGGNNIVSLQIAVGGIAADAVDEMIVIDGTSFQLDTDSTDTTTLGGVPVTITYIGGTFIIAATDGVTPISQAALDSLIRGITYENVSQNPAPGDRTLSFSATDTNANTTISAAVSTITVMAANDAPDAEDTTVSVTEDTPVTVSVTAGVDPDGDPLTVTAAEVDVDGDGTPDTITLGSPTVLTDNVGEPIGTLTVNPDGDITFTPAPDYNGPVPPITYTVEDPSGVSDTAVITFGPVTGVNDAPDAEDTTVSVTEDTPVTVSVTAGVDPDGDPLTVTAAEVDVDGDGTPDTITLGSPTVLTDNVGEPIGTLTVNPDGDITFTPAPDYNGPVPPITYTVEDPSGVSDTAVITFGPVTAANDAPDAEDTTVSVTEDTPVTVSVTAGVDPDGDPLTVTAAEVDVDGDGTPDTITLGSPTVLTDNVGEPIGTLTVNPDGDITFTPAPDYNGPVPPITYTVEDPSGASDTAVITFGPVTGVNDAPDAEDTTVSVTEDTPVTVSVTAGVDPDGDPLTVTAAEVDVDGDGTPDTITLGSPTVLTDNVGEPIGTLTVNPDGDITFTPAPDYNGPVPPITYTVEDPSGVSDTAVITFGPVTAANDAPDAEDTTVSVTEDTPVTVSVTAGVDPDGDPLTVTAAEVDVDGDGTPDTITLGSPTVLTDNVGEPIGTLTVNPDGDITFTPAPDYNGPVPPITYTVEDPSGASDTAVITFGPVTGVNDAPDAEDTTVSVTEDTPVTVSVTAGVDPDGDPLTVTAAEVDVDGDGTPDTITLGSPTVLTDNVGEPIGTLTVNPDGDITFTPAPDYNGPVPPITYTVEDPSGVSDTAVITLGPVTAANDAPDAEDTTVSVTEDTPVTVSVTAGVDPDGDPLTVTAAEVDVDGDGTPDTITLGSPTVLTDNVGEPIGTLTVNPDGDITFTPAPDYNGPVPPITYTVEDPSGVSDTAVITFGPVTGVNDAPDAEDTTVSVTEDTPVTVSVTAGVDPDGDPLTVTAAEVDVDGDGTPDTITLGSPTVLTDNVGEPIGTLTVNPDGDITFTPAPDYNGPVPPITYTVEDPSGVSDTAVITFGPVTAANDVVDVHTLLEQSGDSENSNDDGINSDIRYVASSSHIPNNEISIINSQGPITGTVFDIDNLNSLSTIDVEHPILTAVNGITSLGGIDQDLSDSLYKRSLMDFDVELHDADSSINESLSSQNYAKPFNVDSYLRNEQVVVQVSDAEWNDIRVIEFSATLGDGRALPSWISIDSNGLLQIDPPASVESVTLIVIGLLESGVSTTRMIEVDLLTSLIKDLYEPTRNYGGFSNAVDATLQVNQAGKSELQLILNSTSDDFV